jgi:hypothetical protein
MSKSKKKDKKKVKVKKEIKRVGPTVDERAKEAMSIQPPDENPFKMDNDRRIDQFMRFNRRRAEKVAPKYTTAGRFQR